MFQQLRVFFTYKRSSSGCGLKSIAIKITSMTRKPHCLMIFSDKRFCGNSYVIIMHSNHTNYNPKNKLEKNVSILMVLSYTRRSGQLLKFLPQMTLPIYLNFFTYFWVFRWCEVRCKGSWSKNWCLNMFYYFFKGPLVLVNSKCPILFDCVQAPQPTRM